MTPPLLAMRILHTRPTASADAVTAALQNAGAVLLHAPLISLVPPTDMLSVEAHVRGARWVLFTSAHAVEVAAPFVDKAAKVFPLMGATAGAARAAGLNVVDVPGAVDGATLAAGVMTLMPVLGVPFVFPTSNLSAQVAAIHLRAAGAQVDVVMAYLTLPAQELPQPVTQALQRGQLDAVVCMSPSAVEALCALAPASTLKALLRAAPGPTTAAAWAAHGLPAQAVAHAPTPEGLVTILAQHWPRP